MNDDWPTCDVYRYVLALAGMSLIKATLAQTGGNLSRTAYMLGINRNTLRVKMREHKIA